MGGAVRPGLPAAACLLVAAACGTAGSADSASRWEGTVDTLPSGQVVVRNTGAGAWAEGDAWTVTETLRLGTATDDGPETFGQVRSVELDGAGRPWVLDSQASEIRVFGTDGTHVRTVGRSGEGPGEFAQPMRIDRAPDGRMWVVDPQNTRLSIFDTAGTYVADHRMAGGFVIFPWQGGFDGEGRYHGPVLVTEPGFDILRGRWTADYQPIDTLRPPEDPVEREAFTLQSGNSRMMAGVPFSGDLVHRTSPRGGFWALMTDEYRLFELDESGDTLRTVYRAFDPIPVTGEDVDAAIEDLEWFTRQGGRIDRSKIPDEKPPVSGFFVDDEGYLWVSPTGPEERQGRVFDVFDPEGRLLGRLELPFALSSSPIPRVRDDVLYGVTTDELDVPYVVVARIDRP